jgi:serine protease Do
MKSQFISRNANHFALILILNLVVIFGFQHLANASDENNDLSILERTSKGFTKIAKKVNPSVVFIQVEKTITTGQGISPFGLNDPFDLFNDDFFRRFFGHRFPNRGPRKYRQMGLGSGFIISKDGYILTNNHVVGDADKITVRLNDRREFKAKTIGTDPNSDVALIKIDGAEDLPVLPLGDSDALEVGEWVMAIGNPFGLSHTLTVGVVSAKGRNSVGINDYEDFIQTDAAINPGNSGGPLINMKGEVVGINTAIYSKSGGYMGIGFAIPINMVKAIKKQLIKTGQVTRGYLGVTIQDLTKDLRESFGINEKQGVLIADVSEDSPAERAGIKRGDLVIGFNGKKVKDVGQFRNMVALTPPKTEAKMVVIRNGKRTEITVKLGDLKTSRPTRVSQSEIMDKLGFAVQDITKELAQRFGYRKKEGVLISEVVPGSPAHFAGLRPGFLILEVERTHIKNTKEFLREVQKAMKSKRILLLVQDGDYTRYVILQLR